jgi:hypothetical protein
MKIGQQILRIAYLAAFAPALAAASDNAPAFGFAADAGYQYDSNVNVAEIDTSTGQSDSALLLNAGVSASLPLTGKLDFKLSYDYGQTSYRQFAEFDLAIHHGQGALAFGIGSFDTALTLDSFAVRLGGEPFLDINLVSPSVARLFGESLYLWAAFTRADRQYAAAAERNAKNDEMRADAYLLFDGMQRFLSAGYTRNREDAFDAELDYAADRAMLAYGHRVDLGMLPLDLKARLQFEQRTYANVTEAIEVPRRDRRLRAGVSAAVPLSEHFVLKSEVEYATNHSNLAAARFDETVCSLTLAVAF